MAVWSQLCIYYPLLYLDKVLFLAIYLSYILTKFNQGFSFPWASPKSERED